MPIEKNTGKKSTHRLMVIYQLNHHIFEMQGFLGGDFNG